MLQPLLGMGPDRGQGHWGLAGCPTLNRVRGGQLVAGPVRGRVVGGRPAGPTLDQPVGKWQRAS